MVMRLSDVDLLRELERPELADLRKRFRTRTVPRGAVAYDPHEEENLVFIVVSGKARIYLGFEDKEFTVAILGRGDIYSTHAGTYVQALEDCTLLVAGIQEVGRMLADAPQFTQNVVRVLGGILKASFEIIGSLVFKDTARRLTDMILDEAAATGVPVNGGVEVSLDFTHEQLANMIGASRQTVSTLMNDMIRSGLIEKRSRGVFFIPDPKALRSQN